MYAETDISESFSDSGSDNKLSLEFEKLNVSDSEHETNDNHSQEDNARIQNDDGEWCEVDETPTIFEFKEKGVKSWC